MNKSLIIIFIGILFLSAVSAVDFYAEVEDVQGVLVAELDMPAIYRFTIINNGNPDTVQLYSLVGVSMSPKGSFDISRGSQKIEVKIFPNELIRQKRGVYGFEYQLKAQEQGIFRDNINVKVVPFNEVFEISIENIWLKDESAQVALVNRQKINFENVELKIKSPFFEYAGNVSVDRYGKVELNLPIDRTKTSGLAAGSYIANADISIDGKSTQIQGMINYVKEAGIKKDDKDAGFLIRKTIATRKNDGNIREEISVNASRDIISRLFTTTSLEPTKVERRGIFVNYFWQKELNPGEMLSVEVNTNYTLPVLLIVLIVLIALFVKRYIMTSLLIEKKVSYVKTKGGEFALKVSIYLKARKKVDKVEIIDSMPMIGKLYEKFGRKPDRIDESSRRLFWKIGTLQAGEQRVFSYIIYSKLNVVGRFTLPAVKAVYELNGKLENAYSNRAFFVSDVANSRDSY